MSFSLVWIPVDIDEFQHIPIIGWGQGSAPVQSIPGPPHGIEFCEKLPVTVIDPERAALIEFFGYPQNLHTIVEPIVVRAEKLGNPDYPYPDRIHATTVFVHGIKGVQAGFHLGEYPGLLC